ncbi:MAG: hypothetical protein K5686_07315 [Lachnospiraceae bacterium]|nr:hypothetical protein [Lachnospiraceae bacterium]
MPGEKLISMAENGEFHELVRTYVEVGFRLGRGELTPEEREDYIAFEEYMQEPAGTNNRLERETPKRSPKIITGFLEEMALYRAELLVESGKLAEQIDTRIRTGQVPGTELYIGNEAAIRDISDCMMNGSELYAKTVLTSAGLKLVSMTFDEAQISSETADRLGYESLSVGEFIKSPMREMMDNYVRSLGPRGMIDRKRGESLMSDAMLFDKYGIKPAGSGFERAADTEGVVHTLELADERNKKSSKAVDDYTKTLDAVIQTAKGQLSLLREMEAKKSSNSAAFTAMVEALTDMAGINANLASPALIESHLSKLKEATGNYMKRIDGSIFRGVRADGKARRELAETLSDFADAWDERLKGAGDGRLNEYLPVGAQAESLKKNREVIDKEKSRAAQIQTEPATKTPEIEKPVTKAQTIISKPVTKAQTMERSKPTDLASLMKAEKAEKAKPEERNSVREEVLRKREAIMQKRRENDKAGVVNDGKNQVQQQRGKGGR